MRAIPIHRFEFWERIRSSGQPKKARWQRPRRRLQLDGGLRRESQALPVIREVKATVGWGRWNHLQLGTAPAASCAGGPARDDLYGAHPPWLLKGRRITRPGGTPYPSVADQRHRHRAATNLDKGAGFSELLFQDVGHELVRDCSQLEAVQGEGPREVAEADRQRPDDHRWEAQTGLRTCSETNTATHRNMRKENSTSSHTGSFPSRFPTIRCNVRKGSALIMPGREPERVWSFQKRDLPMKSLFAGLMVTVSTGVDRLQSGHSRWDRGDRRTANKPIVRTILFFFFFLFSRTTSLSADDTFILDDVPKTVNQAEAGRDKRGRDQYRAGKELRRRCDAEVCRLAQGSDLDPASPVVKHGDKETKITLKVADNASLGDFTLKVTGEPSKGMAASSELKIIVAQK